MVLLMSRSLFPRSDYIIQILRLTIVMKQESVYLTKLIKLGNM